MRGMLAHVDLSLIGNITEGGSDLEQAMPCPGKLLLPYPEIVVGRSSRMFMGPEREEASQIRPRDVMGTIDLYERNIAVVLLFL